MQRPAGQATFSAKVLYGFGQAVDAMSGAVLGFQLFYLTAVCGLSPALTGFLLGVSLIADAFVDPLVGSLSDNARSRLGRRHVFMFASFPPIVIGLIMLFSVPRALHGAPLATYVLSASLLLRIGLSAFNVPFAALGAELTDDYSERTRIAAWRFLVGGAAGLASSLLGYNVFLAGKLGLFDRAAYVPFAVGAAAVLLIFGLIATIGTVGAGKGHAPAEQQGHIVQRLTAEMMEAFGNRSFLRIFLAVLILVVAQGTGGALALHAAKFFWHLSRDMLSFLALATGVGGLAGLLLSTVLVSILEKKTILMLSMAYLLTSQAVLPLLRIYGFLPDGTSLNVILILGAVLTAVVAAAGMVALTSMMADATDEHEFQFGARREGLFFAAFSFAGKASSGIGTFLGGIVLALAHFPVDLTEQAGAVPHISTTVANRLGLFTGVVPAVLSSFCLLAIAGYHLDRKRHANIQAELAKRRGILTM